MGFSARRKGEAKSKNVSYDFHSCGCKFVCVNDKFSKPFMSYLGEDAFYSFLNSMSKENKYCSEVMKNILTKNLWWREKISTKCWICDNDYTDNDVKIRDHCHSTEKYRRSLHRDGNINLTLKIILKIVTPILFCKNQGNSILKLILYQMD